jgi:hypothetical protein
MAQVERLISMTAMSVISGPISHGRLKPRSSRESAKGRAALGEGIKLGDQGIFHRDQGMPLSSAIWPLPGDIPSLDNLASVPEKKASVRGKDLA